MVTAMVGQQFSNSWSVEPDTSVESICKFWKQIVIIDSYYDTYQATPKLFNVLQLLQQSIMWLKITK